MPGPRLISILLGGILTAGGLAAAVGPGNARAGTFPYNPVSNGNFESLPIGTGWSGGAVSSVAGLDNPGVAWPSGHYGATIGSTSPGEFGLSQTLSIPASATSASLSYWYQWRAQGEDANIPPSCWDSFYVQITSVQDPGLTQYYNGRCFYQSIYSWTQASVNLQSWAGHDVVVSFRVSAFQDSYALVDDVVGIITLDDSIAPVSSASISHGPQQNSWYTEVPVVTLSATDTVSGVDRIVWHWDAEVDQVYSGPITAREGSHTLTYHAIDAAGNSEAEKTLALKTDTNPPTMRTTWKFYRRDGATKVIVTVHGHDAAAGLSGGSIGRSNYSPGADGLFRRILTLKPGTTTVRLKVIDSAGWETTHQRHVQYLPGIFLGELSEHATIQRVMPNTVTLRSRASYTFGVSGLRFSSSDHWWLGSTRLKVLRRSPTAVTVSGTFTRTFMLTNRVIKVFGLAGNTAATARLRFY